MFYRTLTKAETQARDMRLLARYEREVAEWGVHGAIARVVEHEEINDPHGPVHRATVHRSTIARAIRRAQRQVSSGLVT